MDRVYLDHNATTPLDPRVRAAMVEAMEADYGNPSSVHAAGRAAREAVEAARDRVAELISAQAQNLMFASSGTEANNCVLFSVAQQSNFHGRIVISALEHPSVTAAASRLETVGMEVVRVAPSAAGVIDGATMVDAIDSDTRLLCLMLANNEVGTLQPVQEVAAACRRRRIPLLCDAVQAIGKVEVHVEELGVDYLTLGAHKFYGPLGAAALWVRPGCDLRAYLVGGSQERRLRAGTENVPALVGMGRAAELAFAEIDERQRHVKGLRDDFERRVATSEDVIIHGVGAARLPNTSHLAFMGIDAQALMVRLDLAGYAVATGSACASGAVEPSATLKAMGLSTEESLASLRISFGLTNQPREVAAFAEVLAREVLALRQSSDRTL